MVTLVLADDNAEFRSRLAQFFVSRHEIDVVGVASDGWAVTELLKRVTPDVLLLDLVMPRLDGLETLQMLKEQDALGRTRVIVMSGLMCDDAISRAMAYGASYYMVKPVEPEYLYRRILYYGEAAKPKSAPPQITQETIYTYLRKAGIQSASKGYRYLSDGIWMTLQAKDGDLRVTKAIYPALASRYGVSHDSVERAMRTAIEAAWRRGGLARSGLCEPEKRPGNGAFLARAVAELDSMRA